VLNLSPPLAMKQRWFEPRAAQTMAKYGIGMPTYCMSPLLAV
jgi:hypothetical protein